MKTVEYGTTFGSKNDFYIGIRKYDKGNGQVLVSGPPGYPGIRVDFTLQEFTAFLEAAEKVKKL